MSGMFIDKRPATIFDMEEAAKRLPAGQKLKVRLTFEFDWTDGSAALLQIPGASGGLSISAADLAACDTEIVP